MKKNNKTRRKATRKDCHVGRGFDMAEEHRLLNHRPPRNDNTKNGQGARSLLPGKAPGPSAVCFANPAPTDRNDRR